ncbi:MULTISPECIES: phytanoyl-CoA dioxygenase family protein [Actinosynnema]|uniref:phytanoyl-CoA dioxygenase family protein n=1 Tax=Actinosynnema TaxID=40566 RepID=UPI0020A3F250|nr:phytanoyl-CoA dioxygenase family protein [Actinosynnema pretiosum]MCP2097842.1 Phytanoyl-CoA dioxygenase (PhyH) [Actinosynnema pretiosum]
MRTGATTEMASTDSSQVRLDTAELASRFLVDGFVMLRGALSAEEVEPLRRGVREAHRAPCPTGNPTRFHRHQMFRRGPEFEAMLDREPAVDVAEALLGDNCHVIANNTVYTGPNSGIDRWHVDETVLFPLPEGVLLDPRIEMPCYIVTALYYLDDVPLELGPTQVVPGSHRSGRLPPQTEAELVWDGRGYETLTSSAGDCLLLNGQTWHRGATNLTDDRHRHVLQVTYGRRYIAQRFHPYVNHVIPQEILDRATPRRQRLLGMHEHGPYG